LPNQVTGHKGLAAVITYIIEMKTYNAFIEEKNATDKNCFRKKACIVHPVSGLFK